MRAAQFSAVPIETNLTVQDDLPIPRTGKPLPKNSALIKVAYASLNPVDYKFPEFRLARLGMLGKAPWTPGCDYAGTVIETNLAHVKPGDRVSGFLEVPNMGTLAEYVLVQGSEAVALVPEVLSLKDAASVCVAAQTALQAIVPFVETGSKVLINGASGGTGTYEIQVAKNLGCEVTAICSGSNVDFCKSLGADHVIDYKSVDVTQELRKRGQQYDYIIDNITVGGPIYTNSEQYLKTDGLYNTIAFGPNLDTVIGVFKLFLHPSWLGGVRRKGGQVLCKPNAKELTEIGVQVRDGTLKTSIERVYKLEQIGEAYAVLKSKHVRGKLVIQVAEET